MSSTMAAGSKIQTAHDDTREFIRGLEMTARKVLTNANKRRLEELHRQQCMARRMGAGAEVDDRPQKFVVEVPPGVKDWGDQLASKKMEIASTGLTVGVRSTRPVKHRSLDVIDAASAQGSGFPSLGGSGTSATGAAGAGGGAFESAARKLPRISRSAGSLTFGGRAPSRAATAGNDSVLGTVDDGGGGGARRGTAVARAAVPAAKIDGRLTTNPLFTASMMELTKPPRSAAGRNNDPLNGGWDDEEEAPGGIANMRVVNASKIIGGNSASRRPVSRKPKRQRAETEAQGVTSWSSDDLRVKYRAERDREEAYQAFRLEEQVADALQRDYGQVVAVPEVDRHPLHVAYYAQLERENTRCLLRASARNKMKRFITDVHTVWLTNLAHHPEFRRTFGGVFAGGENCRGDGSDKVDQEGASPWRRGLDGGRDSTAIAASQSQIQSVQPKRAFREAFYYPSTSAASSPRTGTNGDLNKLGGEPGRGSSQEPTENVQDDYTRVDKEGGESPELPPPPVTAPTLAVLACERHRIGPASTAGNNRGSIGGGGIRRSIGGGVGVGGEVNSLLEARTVLLRVLRFAPSPPPPLELGTASHTVSTDTASRATGVLQIAGSDTIGFSEKTASNNFVNDNTPPSDSSHVATVTAANTEMGRKEEAAVAAAVAIAVAPAVSSNTVVQTHPKLPQPQPAPEATWLISSFCPYDGSETGILVDHEMVAKRVGEALSALTPLGTAAGFPASRNDVREPAGGGWAGGGRLRLLRKGMRIPALAVDGHVVGQVLSVIEVFVSASLPPPGEVSGKTFAGGMVGVGESSDGEDARVAAIAADNVVLEVIAYPAAVVCPQSHRHTERQRVILTAESLWQRRRSLYPELTLFDKPPTDLADWLRGKSASSETTRAGTEDGGEEGGAAGADGRESCPRGEGSDFGTKAGGGGGHDWGTEGAHEALGDLVGMVAFGPPGAADGDGDSGHDGCEGVVSRVMPLLLRPVQSVGLVARIATAGAAAVDVATSSVNSSLLPGGVATLTDESRAEVLLSLVRLRAGGRGRSPVITVDGIPSSSIVDNSGQDRAKAWEEEADRVEPLSMRVSGRRAYTREVPGTCCVGRMGVTFTYPQGVERTRAVASFFRDASLSSSDSVMVTVALALDTPRLSPLVTAWEKESAGPEAAPHENVLGIVPRVMIPAGTVLRERVVSELGGTVAPDALILTDAERNVDYCCQLEPATGGGTGGVGNGGRAAVAVVAGGAYKGQPKGVRHRRFMKEMDEQGFRRYAIYPLSEPDGHLQTLGFGVTKRAALPNTSAVCGRSTFHSEQRCTEQLCRQRTAKDYAYVSANSDHRGPSDPGSYSVSCTHERMRALLRTGLERYNAEMARVAAERERQAKDAALQAKVDIGKAQLATRRAREDAAARSLARKDDARNLKISAGADRNRRKWELRVEDSRVVEVRGSWEKRKDSGGSVFYCHAGDETVPEEPFSWDPPECWDAPDLLASSAGAGDASVGDEGESIADSVGAGGDSTELSSLREVGATAEPDNNGGADETSTLPRQYTEEEKISLAVTRLAQNEKLLGALAWRLGIPLANVRPDGREPALARARGDESNDEEGRAGGGSEDDEELEENRWQIELGELDEVSDSDGERGDASDPPGPLPQDHADLRGIRLAQRRKRIKAEKGHGHKQPHQSGVPPLPLAEASEGRGAGVVPSLLPKGLAAAESLEAQIGGLGWRRLARTKLVENFLDKVKNPRMQGPRPEAVNTRPEPRPMYTIDPTKATKQLQDFTVPVGSMFIADVVEEHARVLQEAERRMRREELLAEDDSSAAFDADKFAADGPQQFTTTERRLMALAEDGHGGRSKGEVQGEEANSKAVVAAKTGNLAELEALLYDDVPPDTKDSNGNSLLLLASQQGNKRMVKFLLRKGATMNHQNMDGNSVLHFCYSIGREDLAEYLKLKGADDSLLNGEGLTCYEGLHAQDLDGI